MYAIRSYYGRPFAQPFGTDDVCLREIETNPGKILLAFDKQLATKFCTILMDFV